MLCSVSVGCEQAEIVERLMSKRRILLVAMALGFLGGFTAVAVAEAERPGVIATYIAID